MSAPRPFPVGGEIGAVDNLVLRSLVDEAEGQVCGAKLQKMFLFDWLLNLPFRDVCA